MICLLVKMTVKPEKIDGLIETLRVLVPKVREEPGNHAYLPHRVPGEPNVLVFYEQYENEAALDAHRQHIAQYGIDLKNLDDLLAKPLERQVLELLP